LSVLTLGLNLV